MTIKLNKNALSVFNNCWSFIRNQEDRENCAKINANSQPKIADD